MLKYELLIFYYDLFSFITRIHKIKVLSSRTNMYMLQPASSNMAPHQDIRQNQEQRTEQKARERRKLSTSTRSSSSTVMVIIICGFLMLDQVLVPPQVNRIVIISSKHGIYDLPHELPNDFKFKILPN